MFDLSYDQDSSLWQLHCLTHDYSLTFEQAVVVARHRPDAYPVKALVAIHGATITPENEARIPAGHWRWLGVTPQRTPAGATLWRLTPDGKATRLRNRSRNAQTNDD